MLRPYTLFLLISLGLSNDYSDSDILEFTSIRNQIC